MRPETVAALHALGMYRDAVEWAKQQPSADAAWRNCSRGDWMLWLIGKLSGELGSESRRRLVLAAGDCARLALSVFERQFPEDERPRAALDLVKRYGRGDKSVTLEDVRAASAAAADAADAAAGDDDAAAASAAAAAADAADAAYAAEAAYSASAAAADAADAAAGDDAYSASAADTVYAGAADAYIRVLAECADIVRHYYPSPPSLAGRKGGAK